MKPLTTSVYTFEKLRSGGFLYLDKTADIYKLIEPAFAQHFLSRPRRFGKSLLISTLKAIFQGRRDLFGGLAIDDRDYDWQTYPVIHLDMGTCAADSAAGTAKAIWELVDEQAAAHGIKLGNSAVASRFRELITSLSDRDGKVVILIDEYDKPLLGHLGRDSVRKIQTVLKQFYAVVKTTEEQQRFVLVTGVSKFSQVSIFSDLNNLTDLTMTGQAATLLGYTQEEVEANFPDYIERLAHTLDKSVAETLDELRVWYNGYRFEEDAPTVYNPVSLMKCLINEKFKNYWFETGTPTFLLDLLKRKPVDLDDLEVDENA
ncbi:MAG: AAA family ATPase, partial [Verrucomicrobiota bacterium]